MAEALPASVEATMLVLQDGGGLVFWRPHEVASLTPEFRNRWRGVHRDGSVAHRPTPPPPGPWVPWGPALLQPAWMTRTAEGWQDPAGFLFPAGELPEPVPAPILPPVAGMPCSRESLQSLQSGPHSQIVAVCDEGRLPWKGLKWRDAEKLLPELLRVRRGLDVNLRRLRRIRHDNLHYFLELDNGETFQISNKSAGVPEQIGLPSLVDLQPSCAPMYANYQLRDWPCELALAPADFLKANFESATQLIAHLVWQRWRYRQLGVEREWATGYRAFFYDWIEPTLNRAGFLHQGRAYGGKPGSAKELYMLLFHVMDHLVGDLGYFTFEQFGFVEPHPELRRIGDVHPEIVLVTEKDSLVGYARRLAEEFGLSLRVLGSQSPLIVSEFMVKALRAATSLPVRVVAYVDYDTGGWIVGHGFAEQLRFFGLQVAALDYLIRQECFSAEEKALYAHPCANSTPAHKTKTAKWVAESGGIDGQPLGIHANHVQPYERVRDLLAKVLGGGGGNA